MSAVLLCMSLCSVVVAVIPSMSFIARHGKIDKVSSWTFKVQHSKLASSSTTSSISDRWSRLMTVISKWRVSKSLFKYMYLFGILVSLYHILSMLSMDTSTHDGRWTNGMNSLLLLEFHLLRRLLECCYCTIYGNSLMHVSGLLCGLLHYFLVPLCIVHGNLNSSNRANVSGINGIHEEDSTWTFLSVMLFFVSNYFQLDSHLVLYRMKLKYAESYALPTDSLFQYVCCPHYLMEILIYFSFWMISPRSLSLLCLVIWVASNLSVVANQNLLFYCEKFKDSDKINSWKRIIPFIW